MKLFLLVAASFSVATSAPEVQARPAVKVAAIESDSSCAVYETYWGYWLVLECQKNFPDLRARIQSAIAESGKLTLSTHTGGRDVPSTDYVVTGRISGLGMTASGTSARDYCVGKTTVQAQLDVRMRDAAGRIVHAATISKTVEVGSDVVAGSSECSTNTPWRASYGKLQREIALAATRALSFKLFPLRITKVEGRRVTLNYGAPLLALGTIVQVEDSGGYPVKYRVTAAMGDSATAEPMGKPADIQPGASATVIESDDPAANERRYEKVELPL